MDRFRVACCALAAILIACSSTSSNMGEGVSPGQLPGYAQSYTVVFGAVTGALTMMEWPISLADKDAGLVEARVPGTMWRESEWVTIHVFRADSLQHDSLVHVGFRSVGDSGDRHNRKNIAAFYRQLDLALRPKDAPSTAARDKSH